MSTGKMYLPCGHPIGCLYNFNIGKEVKRYCFGCICEKTGIKPFTDEELRQCTNKSILETTIKVEKQEVKPISVKTKKE